MTERDLDQPSGPLPSEVILDAAEALETCFASGSADDESYLSLEIGLYPVKRSPASYLEAMSEDYGLPSDTIELLKDTTIKTMVLFSRGEVESDASTRFDFEIAKGFLNELARRFQAENY